MINPRQVQLVKLAQHRTRTSDAEYRLILRNVAHVDTCKQLDNNGFEDVMAVFEDRGFQLHGKASDHFRNKVKLRGTFAGERVVFKIRELIAGTGYRLEGLCRRFSHDRTDQVSKLQPAEAYALVEMLKDASRRPKPAAPPPAVPTPSHGGDSFEDEPF